MMVIAAMLGAHAHLLLHRLGDVLHELHGNLVTLLQRNLFFPHLFQESKREAIQRYRIARSKEFNLLLEEPRNPYE